MEVQLSLQTAERVIMYLVVISSRRRHAGLIKHQAGFAGDGLGDADLEQKAFSLL